MQRSPKRHSPQRLFLAQLLSTLGFPPPPLAPPLSPSLSRHLPCPDCVSLARSPAVTHAACRLPRPPDAVQFVLNIRILTPTSTSASLTEQVAGAVHLDLRLVVELSLRGFGPCTEVFVHGRFVLCLEAGARLRPARPRSHTFTARDTRGLGEKMDKHAAAAAEDVETCEHERKGTVWTATAHIVTAVIGSSVLALRGAWPSWPG
ncbi:hypothetical protein ACQ4PT_060798 [Festuca glaucescens]